jgi:hypothetical protein
MDTKLSACWVRTEWAKSTAPAIGTITQTISAPGVGNTEIDYPVRRLVSAIGR